MRNLLCAGFARLRKNRMFWGSLVIMAALAIYGVTEKYGNIRRFQEWEPFDSALFAYAAGVSCALAVFCGLFTGTEHSDGTLRCKLIVGNSRRSVYFSQLTLSVLAGWAMAAVYLLVYTVLGLPLLDAAQMPVQRLLLLVLLSLLNAAAYAAVFHLLAMLLPHKSSAAVACLLCFMALIMCGLVVQGRLEAPEFVSSYMLTVNGVEQTEPQPNPKYLQGAARVFLQFVQDLLPGGQTLQLVTGDVPRPLTLALCALGVCGAAGFGGMRGFEKKDIR